ncbi:IclR family transcriptional regulator [Ancylobacter mangrovi]|uniref:IclR family transcriptional regulator n=1 Tax=Ancylobacter mangrovi TaxID=2972472 RepID=UPI002162E069|nr:IclR family transcriptional regulator C-terminal domain-containing protein [Ancylobacter mangrovi]MCS0505162.1 helix-turn-helix domain-containing protein [Ancylobacter mangrovi]
MATKKRDEGKASDIEDPLLVRSVEKAFRVLSAFDSGHGALSLSQIAGATGLDKSAAQRFTHTLLTLGYLSKDPVTKQYELTPKTLDLGYHYTRSSALVERSLPYLIHLSQVTAETVSLTVLDGCDVVFIARFLSPHMLNTGVIVGSRRPAYCTAPGIAMLAALPPEEAIDILERSDRRPYTPNTVWEMEALKEKLRHTRERAFSLANEEIHIGDISLAAAILSGTGRVAGAVSIGVSRIRYDKDEAVDKFAPLVVATAQSVSRAGPVPQLR